jgi:hypothetical protein
LLQPRFRQRCRARVALDACPFLDQAPGPSASVIPPHASKAVL